jgi:hypothetical protein
MTADRTTIHISVTTATGRMDALDRRDEIVEALKALGIRESITFSGLDVRMVDDGVPTVGEIVTGQTPPVREEEPAPDPAGDPRCTVTSWNRGKGAKREPYGPSGLNRCVRTTDPAHTEHLDHFGNVFTISPDGAFKLLRNETPTP